MYPSVSNHLSCALVCGSVTVGGGGGTHIPIKTVMSLRRNSSLETIMLKPSAIAHGTCGIAYHAGVTAMVISQLHIIRYVLVVPRSVLITSQNHFRHHTIITHCAILRLTAILHSHVETIFLIICTGIIAHYMARVRMSMQHVVKGC